ncbi:MAG: HTH domain-containing protein [Calditrichaeota bacterium]|nr:HTH domain-containing protein [Calditrichota bacterium]MCB9368462.1 HTH domain-containing protein [Calditrichota bacterium]
MAKKWTPSEEKYLLENYGKVPMAELADRFGVTRKAISAKLDKLRQTHGIDPVGARERASARQRRQAQLNEKVPQTGGANPRKVPLIGVIAQPQIENVSIVESATMAATTNVVRTEQGWQPLMVEKKRVTR